MVRLNAILVCNIFFALCGFSSTKLTTAPDHSRGLARAVYSSLDDGSLTLALILQDYILVNSTGTVAWSNPNYAYYDQQLIVALQSQLEAEGYSPDHNQPQADQASILPLHAGLRFLTHYCGPGNWSVDGSTVQNPYFSSIDQCCKKHDECPDTIVERGDYVRYPDLPFKHQIFTRLRCNCDVEFLNCLQNIATFFSYAVAWMYTKIQSNCFDYEYPVMECTITKNDGFFSADRCLTYMVDNSYRRRWQWFDLPYISSNQLFFPQVEYRYELDWYNVLYARNLITVRSKP